MATSKGTLKGISKGSEHAIASNSLKVQNGRSETTSKGTSKGTSIGRLRPIASNSLNRQNGRSYDYAGCRLITY